MHTEVVPIDADPPDAGAIARAAAVLRAGGLVAFPTETVYGLGASALDADAVARIFAAKGRPSNNPLIVHVADIPDVGRVAADWPGSAARLAERFWPGPLTLVLPKRPDLPDAVTAGGPTVAVRVPAHPVALALIRAAGVPIAAPSANRSGYISPTRAEHVLSGLDGRIDMVLDAGQVPGGIESTVLDLTSHPPRLLRPGLVSPAEIESIIGPVARPASRGEPSASPLPSPGMLARHYAPRTPLELAEDGGARVEELRRAGLRVGWLAFGATELAGVTVVQMPCDPDGYAARLYAALHALDGAGVARIIVSRPPESDEWLAVRDRLRRAAAP
ncbi:MAG TPA: L-threonylcarbamoyladenylate synthase [Gemmataceae bacterium]|nr:L-threonylcarbamoyladenylate synthase [Gemmataceae bacterium]